MTRPFFTVATPSLNHAAYLERTLCSVLDQGREDIEYVVLDGGSDDNSPQILSLYSDQLAWWRSGPDRGPADALNRALAAASGRVFSCLPSDDLYLPQALDAVARAFAETDCRGWVVGQVLRIDRFDHDLGPEASAAPADLASYLMHDSGHIPIQACFYRTDLLRGIGGFDIGLSAAWDADLHARLLAQGVTPTVLTFLTTARRDHGGDATAARSLRRGIELIHVARRHADRVPLAQRYALWRNLDRREQIYALAQAESFGGESRRYLAQAVLRHPWWLRSTSVRRQLLSPRHAPSQVTATPQQPPRRKAA